MLAATLTVGFSGSFDRAQRELARAGIGVIQGKLEAYRVERGEWPSNDTGLAALTDGQATPADAFYLSGDQLLDPWGRPFLLVTPGPNGHPYEVLTYGADGAPGGEGANADLSSAGLREDRR
ncbi:MAG: type II secretion system protein GspG [Phycisphaerales bacterium]